ncbi:MAG TPA: acetyl-CoA synthetase [Firmicutes bacterium]|nr:acetyl-CoA synthetase [Candidatus Fermentithermobacillaceae bacterium]
MRVWTEPEVRSFLASQGIDAGRFEFARTAEEAVEKAGAVGYPVAVKVVSREISHKTDAGGVKLDLDTPSSVRAAYYDIIESCKRYNPDAEIQGVIITPMCRGGVEVIAGLTRDPQFGPVLMVGLGGVFVEVFKDVSFRVAPVTAKDVWGMLKELKSYRLLQGFRGSPPADVEALVEFLVKVSRLPFEAGTGEIKELDLNPVRVLEQGRGLVVLDARMVTVD